MSSVRQAVDAVARKGRRKVRIARILLDERADLPRPAGVLEARMATLLRRYDIPMPVTEYEVFDDRCFIGRVDFAYPEIKLAIEVDGYEAHSSVAAFCNDRARQNDLVDADWSVLRFTWWEVNALKASVARKIDRKRRQLLAHLGTVPAA